jgi:hypothetical protein
VKEAQGLICCTCGRECASSFYDTVRKSEMAARVDKVAVQKLAIFILVIIDMNPLPFKFPSLYHLNLVRATGFLIIRRHVQLIQV